MIDFKKPDADFDITTISDNELFFALKKDIVKIIKSRKGFENITSKDIKLNEEYSNRRNAFGLDQNLYPNIVLDIEVKADKQNEHYDLFIDPFNVKIAPHKYDPEMIEDKGLTNSFIKFIITRFPKSNYSELREEYFKKAKIAEKIRNDLLFKI